MSVRDTLKLSLSLVLISDNCNGDFRRGSNRYAIRNRKQLFTHSAEVECNYRQGAAVQGDAIKVISFAPLFGTVGLAGRPTMLEGVDVIGSVEH